MKVKANLGRDVCVVSVLCGVDVQIGRLLAADLGHDALQRDSAWWEWAGGNGAGNTRETKEKWMRKNTKSIEIDMKLMMTNRAVNYSNSLLTWRAISSRLTAYLNLVLLKMAWYL